MASTARSKVKSKLHHGEAHLHLLTNVPTKYQLPTPYRFQDITQARFYRSRSLQRSQRSNQRHTMTLHTYNPPPMSLSSINFLHLTVSEISPGQDFIGHGHYGKVKSKLHHDEAHLHLLTNVPTRYQLPTPYHFRDITHASFCRSRSLWQGQRSNQRHTMILNTYTS